VEIASIVERAKKGGSENHMKALVIFKRQGENQLQAYFIDEKKIRNELSSLKEHGHEVIGIVHIAVSVRVQHIEEIEEKEAKPT
jgi:hypothetical protein